jgi:hypothetical protein
MKIWIQKSWPGEGLGGTGEADDEFVVERWANVIVVGGWEYRFGGYR